MEIDARGKPCPTPVVLTKKALESITEGVVTVLVDSEVSKENVMKFAASQGCSAEVEAENGIFKIIVTKGYACDIKTLPKQKNAKGNIVVYIGSNAQGNGDCELGEKLMKGFISNIKNMEELPATIIFLNTGVYLTTLNDETVNELKQLSNVEILSCGMCLEHFNLKDKLRVGSVTNGLVVMQKLFEADKVIRP